MAAPKMSKPGRKKKSDEKKQNDYFSWSDDEVELLLNVAIDYKVSKSMENIDWESCHNKYQEILEKYKEEELHDYRDVIFC